MSAGRELLLENMKRTGILLLLFLLLLFFFTRPTLVFEDREGEILLLLPFLWDKEFYTIYVHSVEKTPVREYFQIQGRTILLKKTAFSSYGAGLPLDWNGFQREKDFFVIQDIDTSFSSIYYRVSGTPDQYLLGEGREILFQDLVSQGQRLSIRAAPLYSSLWDYLMGWAFKKYWG